MYTKRMLALVILGMAAFPALAQSRDEVLRALRKAVEFYRTKVSTEGGYHYHYANDLSYGRSESAEGPTQIEVQREATPGVGMALLEAWYATQDRFYLHAVRDAAYALVKGQLCSGGWDYLIEFDPAKRGGYRYRIDGPCAAGTGKNVTTLDDNTTQGALRLLMRVDREL
ncbi:MAG: pectic acid lyase, partial [Bryobacteraceae bacterium]